MASKKRKKSNRIETAAHDPDSPNGIPARKVPLLTKQFTKLSPEQEAKPEPINVPPMGEAYDAWRSGEGDNEGFEIDEIQLRAAFRAGAEWARSR